MDKFTFSFRISELDISIPRIGKLIDYDKGENRELISEMIAGVLKEAEDICDIRAEYVICRDVIFDNVSGNLLVNGVEFNVGKIVRGQLKKSNEIAVFLCTAGPKVGEYARILINEKDFLRGYIFDIAGSEIVEAAADKMQENLGLHMQKSNMKITNRYSPGYCGWHVSEQHKLFSLVPENFCGITLNQSALMQPIKSVSGFIGIGEKVRFNGYTCNLCDMESCIYRNHKNSN
jgi:hypothetical protein